MDTTIRNLDDRIYRKLKAHAAMSGITIGEAVNEAIRAYLARPSTVASTASLRDIEPEEYPPGNEQLSSEIDFVVYGG